MSEQKNMHEIEKKWDLLLRLREQELASFDRRRAYEWKFSLSIWTAVGTFVAFSLKDGLTITVLQARVFATMGVLVTFVQWFFQERIRKANAVNAATSITIANDVYQGLTGSELDEQERVRDALARYKTWTRFADRWSTLVHVGISIILFATAAIVIAAQSIAPNSTRALHAEVKELDTSGNVQSATDRQSK